MEPIIRFDQRISETMFRNRPMEASAGSKIRDSPSSEESKKQESAPQKADLDTYEPEDRPKASEEPKKSSSQKSESCTANTDKVDREIEKLKEKKKELEQQINREKDEKKAGELQKELDQVERELRQKDNDAYRRRHTVFT